MGLFAAKGSGSGPNVDEGTYVATLTDISLAVDKNGNPVLDMSGSQSLKWTFELAYEDDPDAPVRTEEGDPVVKNLLTSVRWQHPGSNANKIIKALTGVPPEDQPQKEELVGRRCLVDIVHEEKNDSVWANLDKTSFRIIRPKVRKAVPKKTDDEEPPF